MPPKQKISKASISSPTPLLSPEQAQAAANLPSVVPYTSYSAYASGESSGSISVDGIDGKGSLGISGYGGLVGDSAKTGRPAILPFSPGRFDSSASVAGGPNDPKLIRARLPPPKLTMRQYQSFVQALGSYRRQVQALAAASETFVRTLEEISDFVPAAKINKPHVVGDLDFLIDSTHLIANAHQGWAETLEREFETPLINDIKDIMEMTARRRDENKVKINELVEQLHKEEDRSYKLGKKKQRDIKALQESLNIRMSIADEIKRRTVENQTLHDTLSHQHMEYILENCAVGVRAELENYETIFEGLKKLGAYSDDHPTHLSPQNYHVIRQSRIPQQALGQPPSHEPLRQTLPRESVMSRTPTMPQTDILPPLERFSVVADGDEHWTGGEDRFDVELLRNALRELGD